MKKTHILTAALTLAMAACGSDSTDERDMQKPVISSEGIVANPINCQVYHPGDTIYLEYMMEDNQELGNYHVEVHSDFDHHSHSTESDDDGDECPGSEPERVLPDTAWVFSQSYTIPAGQRRWHASQRIAIPQQIRLADRQHPGDSLTLNTRPGDYHFMIRLTDRAGWQQLRAIAIKIAP